MIKENIEIFENYGNNETTKLVNYYDNDKVRWAMCEIDNEIIWTCHYIYEDDLLVEKRYYDNDFELKLTATYKYEEGELIKYKFAGDKDFANGYLLNENLPVGTVNKEVKVVSSVLGDYKVVNYLCNDELLKEIEYRKDKIIGENSKGFIDRTTKYYYNDEDKIRLEIESLICDSLNSLSVYEYEYYKDGKLRSIKHDEKDLIVFNYNSCLGELANKLWYSGSDLIAKSTYECNYIDESTFKCMWNRLKDIGRNKYE